MKRQLLALGCLTVLSTGCYHVTSKLPGVLDLRSDGGDAPVDNSELPRGATREGFDAFAYGAGVTGAADIAIEDRNHYIIGLVPILNPGSAEEWKAALGTGAIRNVAITEQLGVMTVVSTLAKSLIPCVGPFMEATWDFRARGTRIQPAAATPRNESIPPPPAADGVGPSVGF